MTIGLSVLSFTACDYLFGIFWPLYCLSFHLRLVNISLVSFGHCIVCPSIYGLWLPLWYRLTIGLSVLPFTASDYHFGNFWPLDCLSFHLRLVITTLVSFDYCIVCPSIYSLWLPLWYLLTIVLSVLPFTACDYHFGIFWPLYCLSFHLRLVITSLVSFDHCIVCPSIYGLWLSLWYLLTIVLSVLHFTACDYHFGIFWPLHCLSFRLRLVITTLVSFDHCIVCPSVYGLWLSLVSFDHCIVCPSIYGLWLPLWYLLVIVLSVLPFTACDYHFGIFWPLHCLSFHLRLVITTLVSFDHCIVCPSVYGLWLPLWYLLTIVLSVLQFTAWDYHFGIVWPLHCLSFHLRLVIIALVSFDHCIFCPSIYGLWLSLWYLLTIVLFVLPFTACDYHFGIFWPLYCLSFHLQLVIINLVSFDHCIVCPFIYGLWLLLWYLLTIVLCVLPFTVCDYLFGIFLPLHCLSFHLRLVTTTLVWFYHCIVCPSIYGLWLPLWYLLTIALSVLPFTACDYLFGIFWPLHCLSFHLRLVTTTLVWFYHCIVCPSIYGLWLPLWYLLVIVLSVLSFTACDYLFGIFWPLYCLSFSLRLVITTLVSFDHCIVCPSIYGLWISVWYLLVIGLSVLPFTACDYHFGIVWPLDCLSFHLRLLITTLVSFDYCIVCPSIYSLWLPLWYLLTIVLSVLPFTACDYHFGIFWPLYCLSFHLRLVITSLVSFDHCIVCPSIYGLWLSLWYLLTIVLSVLHFTACDYHFGIFWPLHCLSFRLRLVITTLVSFDHCIVCPSVYGLWLSLVSFDHCIVCPSIYGLWLPLWYLLVIVLSVLPFTACDYHFGIFWPLHCLSFHLRLVITTLVSFDHCIVCPSVYGLWLPLWYLLTIALSVLPFTAYDYHFGIFWPLYCLSFHLRLLITSLVSFDHCIVCPSIYGLWLPLWYLLIIALSVLPYTACDYHFGIFWPLYCLSFHLRLWLPLWYLLTIVLSVLQFTAWDYHLGIVWPLHCLSFHLRLVIIALVSFDHCIFCPSIYGLWLSLWYLLTIALSVLPFTACDYLFGIFWLLHCLSFHLRLVTTTLVSFDHCIVCPSIYGLWLPLWYLLTIVLSVLPFTACDYHLVSIDHCIVCPSIYGFWLPLWYLLTIVLSVLSFTASDYHFGIFWQLYCLSFSLRLVITTLVSFDHCIVCPSIYGFWLPLWYVLTIALSVLPFTASDYHFGIFWPLYCLSFHLRLLITTLVSFDHCIVCPSVYGLWLPLWYLQTFLFPTRFSSIYQYYKVLVYISILQGSRLFININKKKTSWNSGIVRYDNYKSCFQNIFLITKWDKQKCTH